MSLDLILFLPEFIHQNKPSGSRDALSYTTIRMNISSSVCNIFTLKLNFSFNVKVGFELFIVLFKHFYIKKVEEKKEQLEKKERKEETISGFYIDSKSKIKKDPRENPINGN
jgi:hypothetical protein